MPGDAVEEWEVAQQAQEETATLVGYIEDDTGTRPVPAGIQAQSGTYTVTVGGAGGEGEVRRDGEAIQARYHGMPAQEPAQPPEGQNGGGCR